METNVFTPTYAASKDVANATPHTSMCSAQLIAQQEAKLSRVPNVKLPESPDWRNTSSVPTADITQCLPAWENELKDDIDKFFVLDGIKNGFRLIEVGATPVPSSTKNYKSAYVTNKDAAERQIQTEIKHGRYIISKTPPPIISSLGAIPKKKGSIRLMPTEAS